MYKTYFLLSAGNDPFCYSGQKAADAVRALFPDIKGYVQTRVLPDQDSPAFSGAAELWFDNPSSAIAACTKDPGDLLVEAAEIQSCFPGMERVVVRTSEYITHESIKGVYPFSRRPDLTLEAFKDHWWHNHGPIAAMTEEALSYVQIHPLAEFYELVNPDYDGITEISWLDIEAAGRALSSRQMREDQGSDAPNFVDMESIGLFMAKEEIVIKP